ncbi:Uncharacterised protein [Mycobacterium tuberculosis]|nr:Uncharacterised protein [Mycobacterium tuberculosis]
MHNFQLLWVFKISDCITDFKSIDTYHRNDITSMYFRNFNTAKSFKQLKFFNT